MSTIPATGTCLCGAVTIKVESMDTDVGACHCTMCRKWGGGPYMAVDCKQAVSISGEEQVSVYSSSEWAERGFCANCGTHLFYKFKQTGQYMMTAGFMGVEDKLNLDHQIFVDEKPAYYDFSNKTVMMTGEEVFAHFNSE